jgi:uncharacterized RDD family membrane protein YckC
VDASAAQNLPVTKTCLQCGAVLPSSVPVCHFCESSFTADFSSEERSPGTSPRRDPAPNAKAVLNGGESRSVRNSSESEPAQGAAWRGELAQRLDAYRTRRRKLAPNVAQSHFSFEGPPQKTPQKTPSGASAAVAEPLISDAEDFSFTIAIGRPSKKLVQEESRMVIDLSVPSEPEAGSLPQLQPERIPQESLYPVASIDDRRLAGLVDLGCLLFAYGGFLMLFGSLGGQFTLSKLTAVVYTTTFAIVYLQYFALFTIFGGTTPGMMLRNLQVTSFSGEPPTPRQMLLRSLGYMLSAGTFFLGFLWSMWDEDQLTWHDRLSRTYLSTAQTFADMPASSVAHSR